MRITLLIGLLLKYILAILPAILVLFSKRVSGKRKAIWFFSILVIPYTLKEIVFAIIYLLQKDTLVIHGSIVLGGWAPAIPLIWYISAWGMYIYFKKKHKLIEAVSTTQQVRGEQ